jgi:hypothetical protein
MDSARGRARRSTARRARSHLFSQHCQGRRVTEGFDRDDDDRWFIAKVGVAGSNPIVPTSQ